MTKKRVLILHTGGTIGMDARGSFVREPHAFADSLKTFAPRAFELADLEVEIFFNKDSSNIDPADWVALAKRVQRSLDEWDAFVITHGTDTMAFTASAMSLMLKNLKKPIIFTGSQRPLSDIQSDAPRNLVTAVEIAAEGRVNEVAIFFDSVLLRGNRAKKISIPSFKAFESPNFPALARVGVKTEYLSENFLPPCQECFEFDPRVETRIVSLPLFPGVDTELFFGLIDKGVRGVVLQAFGPGDIPIGERSVMHLIRRLTEKGIPTVICSQAPFGAVDLHLYETGRAARDAGAISAGDMTWECVMVKLMLLLGRGLPLEPLRKAFAQSLAGEISP